jgi:MFS family permease
MCNSFWETMLAQGIGCGIGVGLLFLPAISILSQYFFRRRALAIGIAVTGSSIGGICLPIMLNNLIQSHGFEKAVQYTGYIMLASLVLACALMHPRLGPNKHHVDKPRPKQLFESQPYTLVVVGLFLVALGLYFPIFYLQVSRLGLSTVDSRRHRFHRFSPRSTESNQISSSTPSPSSTPPLSLAVSPPTSLRTTLAP